MKSIYIQYDSLNVNAFGAICCPMCMMFERCCVG